MAHATIDKPITASIADDYSVVRRHLCSLLEAEAALMAAECGDMRVQFSL